MANKTVIIQAVTVPTVFPLGTTEGLYHIAIVQNGTEISSVDTPVSAASFPEVPPGDYIARMSKMGKIVEKPFNIPKTEEVFQLPSTLTVVVG